MKVSILNNKISLWQWDVGQRVVVENADHCKEAHFGMNDDTEALVVKIETHDGKRCAEIPNILLQNSGMLYVYLFSEEDDCGETQYRKTIEVKKRQKPSDYVYTETEILDYANLYKRLTNLEESIAQDKDITELPVAESAEGLNLIVNDNGAAKQIAASKVGAQADLNQNDPTAPDYVKNRPFYAETKEITVVPEVSFDTTLPTPFGYIGNTSIECNIEHLIFGCTIDVYFNGAKYECVVAAGSGCYMAGNLSLLIPDGENNGMPFCVGFIPDSGAVDVATPEPVESGTLKVIQTAEVIHKLDSKYVANNVLVVTMTTTNNGGTLSYSVDKSAGELIAAFLAGYTVLLCDKYQGNRYSPMSHTSYSTAYFCVNELGVITRIAISPDGVTVNHMQL